MTARKPTPKKRPPAKKERAKKGETKQPAPQKSPRAAKQKTPAEAPPGKRPIKPGSLTLAEFARLIEQAGARVDRQAEARVRAHLAEGAPSNPDGTINLIHYTAWLVKENA